MSHATRRHTRRHPRPHTHTCTHAHPSTHAHVPLSWLTAGFVRDRGTGIAALPPKAMEASATYACACRAGYTGGACQCAPGEIGPDCEQCLPLYRRNTTAKSCVPCSGNGDVLAGRCVCRSGYTGALCSWSQEEACGGNGVAESTTTYKVQLNVRAYSKFSPSGVHGNCVSFGAVDGYSTEYEYGTLTVDPETLRVYPNDTDANLVMGFDRRNRQFEGKAHDWFFAAGDCTKTSPWPKRGGTVVVDLTGAFLPSFTTRRQNHARICTRALILRLWDLVTHALLFCVRQSNMNLQPNHHRRRHHHPLFRGIADCDQSLTHHQRASHQAPRFVWRTRMETACYRYLAAWGAQRGRNTLALRATRRCFRSGHSLRATMAESMCSVQITGKGAR